MAGVLLINPTHPYLRILIPETGGYAEFVGGKLELDEGDEGYAAVMAEAQRNPAISIVTNASFCPFCDEVFTGKAGKAQLGGHIKKDHPVEWAKGKVDEAAAEHAELVKAGSGLACDVCQPTQVFPDTKALSRHVALVHAPAPEHELTDEEKAEIKELRVDEEHRPGEVAPVDGG